MFQMKSIICAAVLALSFAAGSGAISAEAAKSSESSLQASLQAASAASLSWLNLIDKGSYGESWNQASGLMKLTMHKDEWLTLMEKTRRPLGSVISRQVADERTAENPPHMPKGDYVVMIYKTAFSRKSSAIEIVTLFNEGGDWRVVVYNVD